MSSPAKKQPAYLAGVAAMASSEDRPGIEKGRQAAAAEKRRGKSGAHFKIRAQARHWKQMPGSQGDCSKISRERSLPRAAAWHFLNGVDAKEENSEKVVERMSQGSAAQSADEARTLPMLGLRKQRRPMRKTQGSKSRASS